jgi:hypothetical protein
VQQGETGNVAEVDERLVCAIVQMLLQEMFCEVLQKKLDFCLLNAGAKVDTETIMNYTAWEECFRDRDWGTLTAEINSMGEFGPLPYSCMVELMDKLDFLCNRYNPEEMAVRNDLFKRLSKEARETVDIVFNVPAELLAEIESKGSHIGLITKRSLRRYLKRKKGWTFLVIGRVFDELKQLVGNFL